jgi:hypothetical protein
MTKPAPGLFAAWRNSNGKSEGLPILLMKQRDDTLYALIPLTCSSTRSPPSPLLASARPLICRELRWYRRLPRAAQPRHHPPLTPRFAFRSRTRSALAPIVSPSEGDTDATHSCISRTSQRSSNRRRRGHTDADSGGGGDGGVHADGRGTRRWDDG